MMQTYCTCFLSDAPVATWPDLTFHTAIQDTACLAWQHLLALIDEAAADGRTTFAPLDAMTEDEQTQIVTLPPTIARLTAVKELQLYNSSLVRLPPEIGAMTSLEYFDPYTSYRLHWFPYELMRCATLRDSRVSTRALYGNYKYRWPFPALSAATLGVGDALGPGTGPLFRPCSVCARLVEARRLQQVWISCWVATDVLPLLVHACSAACIAALPPPAAGYVPTPHCGGVGLVQPQTDAAHWAEWQRRHTIEESG
ncbi:MAG TPA: hypothetical protein VGE07_15880 [Herpetosiphonaceae bacterium]